MFYDARHIKEQRALRLVSKPVGAAKRVLLGNSGNRKRLTGKPGEEHVMLRDIFGFELRNIPGNLMSVMGIIRLVSLDRKLVPLGGEDARAPNRLKPAPFTLITQELSLPR